MTRLTVTDLDKLLESTGSYHESAKKDAKQAIRTAVLAAYREADESPIIRDMLMESARTIARLEFEVEGLKEAALVRTNPFLPCPETESGGAYCQLMMGHIGTHYINLEETK